MSVDEQRSEAPAAGALAVVAVLAPVLAGSFAAIFLLVGYILRVLSPEGALAQTLLTTGWVLGAVAAAAVLVAAVGLLLTALHNRPSLEAVEEEPEKPETPARTVRPIGRAARGTLGLASFVVGDRRAHLREEWAAILAGDPGNGITLSPRRRMLYALGFLWAALRMRLRDLAAPLWLPIDWLLSAESRTNGLITAAVGTQVVYIQHEDGLHTLLTEGWGWCAGCGIALRLLVGWLRRLRGIELASARGNTEGR